MIAILAVYGLTAGPLALAFVWKCWTDPKFNYMMGA